MCGAAPELNGLAYVSVACGWRLGESAVWFGKGRLTAGQVAALRAAVDGIKAAIQRFLDALPSTWQAEWRNLSAMRARQDLSDDLGVNADDQRVGGTLMHDPDLLQLSFVEKSTLMEAILRFRISKKLLLHLLEERFSALCA